MQTPCQSHISHNMQGASEVKSKLNLWLFPSSVLEVAQILKQM